VRKFFWTFLQAVATIAMKILVDGMSSAPSLILLYDPTKIEQSEHPKPDPFKEGLIKPGQID
jgi:hypothetical protein